MQHRSLYAGGKNTVGKGRGRDVILSLDQKITVPPPFCSTSNINDKKKKITFLWLFSYFLYLLHACPSTQWTACMDLKWLLLPWANQLICSVLTHRIQSLEYPNSITRAMILQKWQPLQRQKAILSKNANKDITFLLKIAERKNDFFASLFKKATFQLPFLWFFFWTSRFFFSDMLLLFSCFYHYWKQLLAAEQKCSNRSYKMKHFMNNS